MKKKCYLEVFLESFQLGEKSIEYKDPVLIYLDELLSSFMKNSKENLKDFTANFSPKSLIIGEDNIRDEFFAAITSVGINIGNLYNRDFDELYVGCNKKITFMVAKETGKPMMIHDVKFRYQRINKLELVTKSDIDPTLKIKRNLGCGYCDFLDICSLRNKNNFKVEQDRVNINNSDLAMTTEQTDFMDSQSKVVLCDSVAGSGKSTILVEKIYQKYILEKGMSLDEILMITFTNRGKTEFLKKMMERKLFYDKKYHSKYKKNISGELNVFTFHELGLRYLQKDLDLDDINFSTDNNKLFRDFYQFLIDKKYTYPKDIIDNIIQRYQGDYAKLIGNLDLLVFGNNFDLKGIEALDLLLTIKPVYKNWKDSYSVFTFGDILKSLKINLYKGNSDYKIIAIDEFQDSSEDEIFIVKNLIDSLENVLLLGDSTQSIFEWRGALTDPLTKSKEMFAEDGVEEKNLMISHRTPENISLFANILTKGLSNFNTLKSANTGGEIIITQGTVPFELSEGSKAVITRTNKIGKAASFLFKDYYLNNVKTFEDLREFKFAKALLNYKTTNSRINLTMAFILNNSIKKEDITLKEFDTFKTILDNVKYPKDLKKVIKIQSSVMQYLTKIILSCSDFDEMEYSLEDIKNKKYEGNVNKDTVFITTVHSSKGMQFENVFIFDIEQYFQKNKIFYIPQEDVDAMNEIFDFYNYFTNKKFKFEFDKQGKFSKDFEVNMKILFTAITRSSKKLFLLEKEIVVED